MKVPLISVLASAPVALAAVRGFNYAAQGQNHDTYASQFRTAAALEGANDYTGARLYTMIQEGTTNTPISAIQAAIDTQTTLLLGLWASVDQQAFNNELSALKTAIQQYGSQFADLVTGISVGSEDLYRISPIGIAADSGYGQSPDVLVDYIGQVREAIQGTALGSKPVGHVDTWNVYVNSSNAELIAACDWLGLDEYPYFQTTDENSIDNAQSLFFEAYDKVGAVAGGKPIWITEAGWPVSGPVSNLAVASVDNAETFWQEVACELERREINTWWYILADAGASPSFGVSDNGKPLYNLDCSNSTRPTSSSSAASSSHASSTSAASSSGPASTQSSLPGSQTADSSADSSTATSEPVTGSTLTQTVPASTLATVTPTGTVTDDSSSTASASESGFTGAASRLDRPLEVIALGVAAALMF